MSNRLLLTSIPGIGDTTAANFIAELPDVTRFHSANQLAVTSQSPLPELEQGRFHDDQRLFLDLKGYARN